MVRRSIFEKIFREMQFIHQRLDDLERSFSSRSPPKVDVSEVKLVALSDHLRKTYVTVASRGECDANVVSALTGRSRALESNYLNQLCRMGWLNRRRNSKTVLFCLAPEEAENTQAAADGVAELEPVSVDLFKVDFKKFLGGY